MMEQYLEIKAANPGLLLFYRMGDFYELFFEDAEIASRALGIVLTKRGKHAGDDIPMCGVPVERAEDYLHRLIAQGHRVAVCEQTEDPAEAKKRGAKSVVKRDVVRLVTPGTLTEDTLLDARANNYLLAMARSRASAGGDRMGLAWIDMSTSEFIVTECAAAELAATIARINPNEVIVADALFGDETLGPLLRELASVTPLTRDVFDSATAERRLCDYFAVATMEAFGTLSRLEATAAAACVTYIERTQVGKRPPLSPPSREAAGTTMAIDPATRANLELTRTLVGRAARLAAGGARLHRDRGRLAPAGAAAGGAVDGCRRDRAGGSMRSARSSTIRAARDELRTTLHAAPDMARALARLVGRPRRPARSCSALRRHCRGRRGACAAGAAMPELPRRSRVAAAALRRPPRALAEEFARALADELPLIKRDGGFVRAGYEPALDEARALRDESRRVVAAMQARYADETGVKALEDPPQQRARLLRRGDRAARRQADVAAAERDLHPSPDAGRPGALHHLRARPDRSEDRQRRRPRARPRARDFREACARWRSPHPTNCMQRRRRSLRSMWRPRWRSLPSDQNYVRPEVDGSKDFVIEGGRHPVVEQALARDGQPFIANACDLSPRSRETSGQIWIVTGPNMAGKSTFLRQNALIALMAQIGSFVPAKRARIGIVDRLFSRVGAADDLARGRSTFMVEMVETAAILNQAGERALVILDEIGRGTATFDGLSIAWAAIEHLHEENRCRALFATHYHELTALGAKLPRLFNATVRVKEWQGDVVFLHEVMPGAADRSYGIQVAKLAGLPAGVIARAKTILAKLEAQDRSSTTRALADDLPLFATPSRAAAEAKIETPADKLLKAFEALHPDDMSPREALDALYALKKTLGN